MTAPLPLTVTTTGVVHYGNQTYRQVHISKLPPSPVVRHLADLEGFFNAGSDLGSAS